MSQQFIPDEPVPDHLADTGPGQAVLDERENAPTAIQRVAGLFSLLGATVLTVAAMVLIVLPGNNTSGPNPPPDNPINVQPIATSTAQADTALETQPTGEPVNEIISLPTMNAQAVADILATPIAPAESSPYVDIEAVRNIYNPFTIIPERSRSGIEEYTIQSGDTIFAIAERYRLTPESLVWGNDHSLVEGLRPGRIINILPVDGVYHQVLESETILQVAERFHVDPYDIIDSEFNDLFNYQPGDALPEGMWVVVPGGQADQIGWNPVVERVEGGSAGANGAISFASGEAGSCGLVTNPGGSGWARPIGSYTWIRGFSGVHSGVDLSAPIGSPVFAANGGAVIFAGWNSYGYGYTIVLAHGPYTTLYGHLSAINVGCAQYVSAGQQIGAVGSSGNSSGPHLHFEIRYLDSPQDPTYTMPF
jgi:hypothetical protein